jgi:hypothetical protein
MTQAELFQLRSYCFYKAASKQFKQAGVNMTEEDEAFNEIERRSKAKKDAVESSVNAKEALTKLLTDSYDQGVKDALESVTQTSNELQVAGYERGFIDGMQKQAQSSVDKAVNAMSQRTWVGLTRDEQSFVYQTLHNATSRIDSFWVDFANAIEAKLKEKNT